MSPLLLIFSVPVWCAVVIFFGYVSIKHIVEPLKAYLREITEEQTEEIRNTIHSCQTCQEIIKTCPHCGCRDPYRRTK